MSDLFNKPTIKGDETDNYHGHSDEHIVGYVMLGICGLFLIISFIEIVIKTVYGIVHRKKGPEEMKLQKQLPSEDADEENE